MRLSATSPNFTTTSAFDRSRGRPLYGFSELKLCRNEQRPDCRTEYAVLMAENIKILKAERDGDYGLLVEFSDGTEDAYSIEELTMLRPHRPETRIQLELTKLSLPTTRVFPAEL
jgi:hypothetical protein